VYDRGLVVGLALAALSVIGVVGVRALKAAPGGLVNRFGARAHHVVAVHPEDVTDTLA
jgi:hypothetical protein